MDPVTKTEIDIMEPEAESIKIDSSMFVVNPDNSEDTKSSFNADSESDEHQKVKKKKAQNQASMLQRTIEIKLENEEIQSYICGKDIIAEEPLSQHELSGNVEKSKKINNYKTCEKSFTGKGDLNRYVKNTL